ncbi:metalloregulator ArsR/SmtB family transcription factor [Actinokineospora inagensis]|uniref:metalloregulator ArsR/SmtB family transcription factor n=1 Tax=Actinokineospora inagensis TaxID=103730 RepID=UPI00041308EB|nr:metalloregulator ArsR/SmtB family transcription factor [Actinokineospora inagensis]
MDEIAAALGDGARWRIVELLAERPRSVGELADLAGLRQPQTTKHLQTLARTGIVSVHPLGQRRVYAIETAPLRTLEDRLRALIATAVAHSGERDVLDRYRAAIESEATVAQDRWADGRAFTFERSLAAPVDVVWRQWVDPDLLAAWCAPPSMTITTCAIAPDPGGDAVLEYQDADGRRYLSSGRVHTADAPSHLVFDLSVLDAAGAVFFTGHYDLTLSPATASPASAGTALRLDLHITETTAKAVPFIAGISAGWGQVLDNLVTTIERPRS